jgi:hypothetical protein
MTIPAMAPGRYLACRIGWERLAELLVSEPAGDPACAAGYLAPGGAIRLEVPGGEPGSSGSVVE